MEIKQGDAGADAQATLSKLLRQLDDADSATWNQFSSSLFNEFPRDPTLSDLPVDTKQAKLAVKKWVARNEICLPRVTRLWWSVYAVVADHAKDDPFREDGRSDAGKSSKAMRTGISSSSRSGSPPLVLTELKSEDVDLPASHRHAKGEIKTDLDRLFRERQIGKPLYKHVVKQWPVLPESDPTMQLLGQLVARHFEDMRKHPKSGLCCIGAPQTAELEKDIAEALDAKRLLVTGDLDGAVYVYGQSTLRDVRAQIQDFEDATDWVSGSQFDFVIHAHKVSQFEEATTPAQQCMPSIEVQRKMQTSPLPRRQSAVRLHRPRTLTEQKSWEAMEESKRIDKELFTEVSADSNILKLLLLGAGESGKSTLFKQMIQLYGKGFDEEMRKSYAPGIRKNLFGTLQTLVRQSDLLPSDLGCRLSETNAPSKSWVIERKWMGATSLEWMDAEFAGHCKRLWSDTGLKRTFQYRAKFQCIDSAPHFFERCDAICHTEYVPSYQDVLMCRARTTGIVETEFTVHGKHFKMMDVGGQRSERKKWIHCFEAVTAVIFVAAISEYDQALYEDPTITRLDEALTLFHEICNSKWFKNSSMLLFLNKRDLFAEKIKQVDLKDTFSDYDGGLDYDKATGFIKTKFLSLNECPDTMTVYTHITCATDADSVSYTFNAVRDILIEGSLKGYGLT